MRPKLYKWNIENYYLLESLEQIYIVPNRLVHFKVLERSKKKSKIINDILSENMSNILL